MDEYDSDAIDSGGDDSSDVILALICDSDEDASERPNATQCEKIEQADGGHAIFKRCFPNPTSPPPS